MKAIFRRCSTFDKYTQLKSENAIPDGAIIIIEDTEQLAVRYGEKYILINAPELKDLWDALNKEIADRTEADRVLTEALNKEIADRTEADAQLRADLEQEIADREAAITELTQKLNDEIAARIAADEVLTGKLDKEIEDRQKATESLAKELGFVDNEGVFTYEPVNKDLAEKTVSGALDFLADEKYRSEMPDDLIVPNKIGGLAANQTAAQLKKKSISQILDDILFPELQPTVTEPSASISFKSGFTNGGIYEVGATAPTADNFTVGFSQGSSTVAGQPTLKRAGEWIKDEQSFIYYGGSTSNKSFPEKVVLNSMSYNYQAHHAEGDVLLTSKGNKASRTPNPLPEGTVHSGAVSINGTYPYFCNGASASSSTQDTNFPSAVAPDTKLPLVKWSTTLIGTKFASEAGTGTRLTFDFPSTKKVSKVEFMNTVSGKWEPFAGVTSAALGNKTIQGNEVAYDRLTTNGALSGAIQLRFTIANK